MAAFEQESENQNEKAVDIVTVNEYENVIMKP